MKRFLLLLSLVSMVACTSQHSATDNSQASLDGDSEVTIVTSMLPLYSLTSSIVEGSENIDVVNLVPANTSIHSFSMKPTDAKALEEASLVVINGVDLEVFLESYLEDISAEIVDTSKGIELIKYSEDEHEHDDDHDDDHEDDHEDEHEDDHEDDHDDHDHVHGEYDPHIWMSPINAMQQADTIAEAIISIDPENKELYQTNLENLLVDLENLHHSFEESLSDKEVSNYIAFHDAYAYFEAEYGLSASAHLVEIPGIDPSSKQLAEIASLIREESIEVAFTEPQFSPQLLETLAADYDLEIFTLDPLGQSDSADGYIEMQYANLEQLLTAFGIE